MEKIKILTERLIIRNYEEKYLAINEQEFFEPEIYAGLHLTVSGLFKFPAE